MDKSKTFRENNQTPSKWIQAVIGAFSTYSTIPMQEIQFTSEGLRHILNAFPLVGIVLGFILSLWIYLANLLSFSALLTAVVAFVLNLLLTGAIHLDGYADCMDAIFSRREKEEQLRIMKDPHIGPMAVIALIAYSLLETALLTEVIQVANDRGRLLQFVLSLPVFWGLGRALSGRIVLDLPKIRKEGMAHALGGESSEKEIRIQNVWVILFALLLIPLHGWMSLIIIPLTALLYLALRFFFLFKYDGVSGDMAGLYYCAEEVFFLLVLLLSLKWR